MDALINYVLQWLQHIFSRMLQWLADTIGVLIDYIASLLGQLTQWLADALQKVLNVVQSWIDAIGDFAVGRKFLHPGDVLASHVFPREAQHFVSSQRILRAA